MAAAPRRAAWSSGVERRHPAFANPLVESVFVADGPDEADKWIADRAGPGDVVVTGDIPLAARCVAAGARVVKHNGEELTAANIGMVLATRDLMADLRAADPFRQGGGASLLQGRPRRASSMCWTGCARGAAQADAVARQPTDLSRAEQTPVAVAGSPAALARSPALIGILFATRRLARLFGQRRGDQVPVRATMRCTRWS